MAAEMGGYVCAVCMCVHVLMCVCTPVLAEGEGKSNQLTSDCYLSV